MIVRQHTRNSELDELIPQWNRLTRNQPLNAPGWLATWWRHFGASSSHCLSVLSVVNGAGELVAVAPWYCEASPLYGRVLRSLGSSSICTDYHTIPCKPGWSHAAVAAIVNWLTGGPARAASWDLLHLECVSTADETMRLLVQSLERGGAIADERPQENCWRLQLPADWETFLAMLSKSHRKRVRRLERTYFATGRARLHTVKSPDQLDEGFAILTRLHSLRWSAEGMPGVFDAPRMREFHRDAMEQLLAAGQLQLSWLELDGRAVAADYSFTCNRTLYTYQSGMSPQAAAHEPGSLALIALLQAAIRDGYEAVDFLRGDEPYKRHWRAEACENAEIRVFPGSWPHKMRHALWSTAVNTRDSLRALRNRLLPAVG